MNKKYIDFVPTAKKGSAKSGAGTAGAAKAAGATRVAGARTARAQASSGVAINRGAPRRVVRKPAMKKPEPEEVSLEAIFAEKPRPAGVSARSKGPKLGVIEDLQPKFVKDAEVSKRPLSSRIKSLGGMSRKATKAAAPAKTEAAAAKTESVASAKAKRAKLSAKKAAGLEDIFETALKAAESTNDNKTAKIPKTKAAERPRSPFVNTEKVNKRPLSKNVYQKKVVVPAKEEPSGPVTIIAKPEKDSRVGTIVAIVVTIVLGATAGTVAFLLLPK